MLVKIKGLLTRVSHKENTERGTEIVKLYLRVPEKKNEFDEIYQRESTFEVKAINKQIGKIPSEWIGETFLEASPKVELSAFLNSMENETNGTKYYNLNLSLAKIELI